MGGNNYRQKKSSSSSSSSSAFSVLNIFKYRKPRRSGEHDNYNNNGHVEDVMMSSRRKVRPLDIDEKGPWLAVADPRIDTKASAFIANFHADRISESERQIFQAGKPT